MSRLLTMALILGLALGLISTAEAGKGQKKKKEQQTSSNVVLGTIKSLADEGKSIAVEPLGAKKKKDQPATLTTLKITEKTKIEYVGIDNKDEQKLQEGYFVMVALDPENKDTAASIKVTKAPQGKKKKAKKNA